MHNRNFSKICVDIRAPLCQQSRAEMYSIRLHRSFRFQEIFCLSVIVSADPKNMFERISIHTCSIFFVALDFPFSPTEVRPPVFIVI